MAKLSTSGTTTAELIAHGICVILTLIGVILVGYAVNENAAIADAQENQIIFAFVIALVISLSLLLNAGRSLPALVPLTIGLGYFWFPQGIALADNWREQNESAARRSIPKDDLEKLLTGAVFALTGTFAGVLVEASFPKPESFKGMRPVQFIGFFAFLLVIAGLITVWIHNDRDNGQFDDFLELSIQTLIAIVFCLDALLFPEPITVAVSLFLATFTACNDVNVGILYDDIGGNSDQKKVLQGFLVAGLGLAFIVVASVIVGTSGGAQKGKLFRPARQSTSPGQSSKPQ